LAKPIPVGDGAELIARRPDVRAAERRLAAATARIGVSTADLFPRVTFGGSIGITSNTVSSALTADSLRYFAGPGIQY
jgi:outer membrane protein TolC